MELSYLHYQTYQACPLKYMWSFVKKPDFRYTIDRRNAFIGLVLQKLVERFYVEKWWQEKDPLLRMRQAINIVCAQYETAERIWFSDAEREKWRQVAWDACEMIIAVIRAERLLTDQMYVEREEEVAFFDDHKLWLKPDFIIVYPKTKAVTLIDGKGGATVGKYVSDDQLFFYCLGVEKVYGKLPDKLGWWWYRHGRIVWVKLTLADLERVQNNARSYIAGIKSGMFDATPGDHCRLCDYRVGCKPGQAYLDGKVISATDVEIPGNFGEVGF